MSSHHIVIEGSTDFNFEQTLQVTCVDSGRRFYLFEAGAEIINDKYRIMPTDEQAVFFMNGQDGCKRCDSTDHELLGAVKR